MNKSETKEVQKVRAVMASFETNHDASLLSYAARSLATLVRSTRTNKARVEIMAVANELGVSGHTDFVTTRWA